MSDRKSWKMLHLLYNLKPGKSGLTSVELGAAGVDCDPDSIQPLVDGKAVEYNPKGYSLTQASRTILRMCVVANRRWSGKDILVDYPEVFVIMPFSEKWSDGVYKKMIHSAVTGANFNCIRGDSPLRVGDLTETIWNSLMKAGLIIADVSALNANVFYEIGLAHALGKDVMILKQKDSNIPADFGGSHYYEYELNNLPKYKKKLQKQIEAWGKDNLVNGVKSILNSN